MAAADPIRPTRRAVACGPIHYPHEKETIPMNRLTVAFFRTQDATNYTDIYQPYLDGANAMLKPFSMSIEVYPTNGANDPPRVLGYTGPVFDSVGSPGDVRQLAHVALPNGRGIPVIFCKRQTDDAKGFGYDYGSTIEPTNTEANGGVTWLPYVLINTQLKSVANEVLLHELIHAAYGPAQPDHDKDPSSAFYKYGSEKDGSAGNAIRKLLSKHVDALRKAYFAVFMP
jgi:hypothetical protein